MPEAKPNKTPAAIASIALNEKCYKNTGVVLRPSFINYIFGNNGTGKSTIGEAIKTGNGVTYNEGKAFADYIPLVFNQEYINANMRSYHELNGVFTFNEDNGVTQEKIDLEVAKQTEAGNAYNIAKTAKEKKEAERIAMRKKHWLDCFNAQEGHRSIFELTQAGKGKSEPFMREVMAHDDKEHSWGELELMYNSAFSDTAKRYDLFHAINDSSELDHVAGADILDVVIVNVAETGYARFLNETGASKWVQEGHEKYHALAGDKCPYCGRDYEGFDFEKMFIDSFDESYAHNLQKLNQFFADYRAKANELFITLRSKPAELYPAIDIKTFDTKLNELQVLIQDNIAEIQNKINNPQSRVSIKATASVFQELLDIIAGYNKMISENNAVVAAGPKKKTECKNYVFEMMRHELNSAIEAYNTSDTALGKEIDTLSREIEDQSSKITASTEKLKELRSSGTETETAKNNINRRLAECGFQGFKLDDCAPQPETIIRADGVKETLMVVPPHTYSVIRTETGKVAENLSEGEKNFIAFLYFYEQVFGSLSSEEDRRGKIVVIDDPVSSMDSKALFAVGAYVRQMIEVCHNSYDNRKPIINGSFIKQIFILTHNTYFFKEVAGCYQNDWYCTTYYLLQKTALKTKVILKEHRKSDEPTEWENENPVKHHYAAQWDEFKELHSNVPLMHVAKCILEHYFIQLCGYDRMQLRDLILEEPDNKYKLTHDENGNEDTIKYDMTDRMLSYMTVANSGIDDDIYYVDAMDEGLIRDTFKAIFTYMRQEQHYDMMMAIK